MPISKQAAADRGAKTTKVVVHPVAEKSAWKLVPVRAGRKVCRRCATSRPLAEFSTNAAHRDGKCDFDRTCARQYAEARRAIRRAAGTTPSKKPTAKKPASSSTRRGTTKAATGGQKRAPRAPRPTSTPIARVTPSTTTVEAA